MTISAKKSLGQNFLKDEKVLKNIADSIYTTDQDLILEIGPGTGALTKYLVQKPGMYLAYEIDERMKNYLSLYQDCIRYQDFLKCNISKELATYSYQNLYVMANIPYYITTPILEKIINYTNVSQMVLLVQKEVAQRFCAKTHTRNYGYFTVYLRHYFDMEILFEVSRNCFDPKPNVDSAVVKFMRKENIQTMDMTYFAFIKQCFANKRKTLYNNLKNYDWEKIVLILNRYGYTDKVRAEEVSPEVFEEIFWEIR